MIPQAIQAFVNKYREDIQHSEKAIRMLPPYYVSKPFYIGFGGNKNPLFSVPMAFMVTDYLIHQMLVGQIVRRLFTPEYRISKDTTRWPNSWPRVRQALRPRLLFTAPWFALSIPIAVRKHMQNENTLNP